MSNYTAICNKCKCTMSASNPPRFCTSCGAELYGLPATYRAPKHSDQYRAMIQTSLNPPSVSVIEAPGQCRPGAD